MSTTTGKGKAIFRVVSGNFLEMFDFMVYGFYATAIAKTFFPTDSAFASLMLSLATFGAGFLMRPLGAIFLGAYIDRHGRKKGLVITLAMMAAGTVLIACVPGYATLGVAAPLIVLFGRLLQGFSAGVELGGVSVYLAEIATPGRKGFFVSWQSASQQAAVVFAGLLGVGLNHWLSPEEMGDWGWRVPFLIGCLIVPVIFVIRRSLEETPEFQARKHRPTLQEIVRSIGQNFGIVIAGMALVVMTTGTYSAPAGGVALAVLMLPIVVLTAEESMKMVPKIMKDAAYGMGCTRSQVIWKIVLPTGMPAILTGVMLAVARAAGETAPLLFTALFSNYWIYHDGSLAVMNPTASPAVPIYNFSGMPFDNQLQLAWAASLVLVMIVLVVNIVSRIFGKPKY